MYDTREEAMAACIYESRAARRYMKAAIRFAIAQECRKAWNMADIARTAAQCALQAHERLRELSEGNLTAKELIAFNAAEIAQADATKAESAAATAVDIVVRETRN